MRNDDAKAAPRMIFKFLLLLLLLHLFPLVTSHLRERRERELKRSYEEITHTERDRTSFPFQTLQ